MMITGHRQVVPAGWSGNPWPENNAPIQKYHTAVYNNIYSHVEAYANTSDGVFITGMAIGADQLFAQAVIRLMDQGMLCRLIAAVPFKGQEAIWPQRSKEIYFEVLARCEVNYISSPGYTAAKMQKRNEWMVNRATSVLAVWDGKQTGGTYNAVQAAKKAGKEITVISPVSVTLQ